MIPKSELISSGEIAVVGRLVDASNATLLANIKDCDPKVEIRVFPQDQYATQNSDEGIQNRYG